MGETKTCTKCHVEQPIEQFGINRRCIGGRLHQCRSCKSLYYREYRKRHKSQRTYDKEANTLASREYRAKNLQHYRDYQRAYHAVWDRANRHRIRRYGTKGTASPSH